uniref:CD4-2 molecule, tandem duplicate 2 n=1 Tax=Scatophagus argus TaxID=75038 RepID=UPI001ED7DD35|nr:CD4-2 molecule, tandem duplicate 2 [Scatophagus argus]
MKTIVLFGFVLGALSAAGEVFVAKPGEKAKLKCGATTATGSLTWKRQDELIIHVEGKSGFSRKGKGDIVGRVKVTGTVLEISAVKEEDAGEFTCSADGNTQSHTLFVVSVSASPPGELYLGSEVTLNCQVKNTFPELQVHWKRPDGSPHLISATVQLKPVAHSHAGTWTCEFTHKGKSHNVSLDIKVKEPPTTTLAPKVSSQSSKDISKTSCVKCKPTPNNDLLGLKWWMWIIIGVGSLIVVLLIIFVICMYKRFKRRKRRLQKLKNSRQPLTNDYCQCNRPTAAAKTQQGRRREKPSDLLPARLSNGVI